MVFKQIREQIKQRRSDKRQATQKKPKTTAPRPRPWNKKSVERKASTNKSILAPLPPKKVLEPPKKLIDSIEHAKKNNFELLIGLDSNAHTCLTGDRPTNARGYVLEDLIMRYGLDIANKVLFPPLIHIWGKQTLI